MKKYQKIALFIAFLSYSLSAAAASTNWTAAAGSWTSGANWDNGVPTSNVDAFVQNAGGIANLTTTGAASSSLTIAGIGANVDVVNINSGGNLTTGPVTINSNGTLNVGNGATPGTLTLSSLVATGTAQGVFDNATLIASASNPNFITGNGTLTIGPVTGLTINSNGFNVESTSIFTGAGGALTKVGAGTLTLTGNNPFSGGATISAGTLQLGDGTTTGNVDSNILNNTTLVFDPAASTPLTYTGHILGPGNVVQLGTGTTILTGTNTYLGGTLISGGTLQLGNGGATGSILGNVVDNGTFSFNLNTIMAYGNVISGTGGLTQLGSGLLALTGTNTFTGTTLISGGVLSIGNGGTTGSIVGNVINNSELDFDRSNTFTYGGAISGTGLVDQFGFGTTILTGVNTYTGMTAITSGTLQLGNGGTTGGVSNSSSILDNGALIFDLAGLFTYNNVISGTGTVTQNGPGTVVLNGIDNYTGNTTVNAGTLVVGDVAHPGAFIGGNATVNSGGTLRGHGTVAGNLTNNGTVFPGSSSIGTLTVGTVASNYIQSAAGTYTVALDQLGNASLLAVTGNASLNGALTVAPLDDGFLMNHLYRIIATGGTVSGQFTNPNPFNVGFLLAQIFYHPSEVDLALMFNANAFESAAITPNQIAVANYILATGGTTAVQNLIAVITTPGAFRAAMDQISGATYATNAFMLTRAGYWFSNALADRFQMFPSCEGTLQNDYCEEPCNCCPCLGCNDRNQFWFAAHGAHDDILGGDVSGLDTAVGNVALGYDFLFSACTRAKLGIAAAYTYFSGNARGNERATTSGNLYQFGLYGYSQIDNWLLGAEVDLGLTQNVSVTRQVQGAHGLVAQRGDYKARLYDEQIRLGYNLLPKDWMRIMPFVGVIGQQLKRDSFIETTLTGFELNVSSTTYYSTRSQLGILLEFPTTHVSLKPFVSVDWEHEFGNQNAVFDASLVGVGGTFHIQGATVGRDTALVKAGSVLWSGDRWNVSLFFQGWYGQNWQENGATLELSVMM